MQAGERAYLRGSDEPVDVVAVLDAAGTLLVTTIAGDESFQVARDDVISAREKHSCGCCG